MGNFLQRLKESKPGLFQYSIRIKLVLLIFLPLLTAFLFLSGIHYYYEGNLLQENILTSSVQLGDLLLRSMRFSMFAHNEEEINRAITNVKVLGEGNSALIVDLDGEIKHGSDPDIVNITKSLSDPDCIGCHRFPAEKRPRAITNPDGSMMRISSPILNEAECHACHGSEPKYLGTLLLDISLAQAQRELRSMLARNLLLSLFFTLGIVLTVYILIDRLIVRRVERLHHTMQVYAAGDFSVRQPTTAYILDELSDLIIAFNDMADQIAQHEKKQLELTVARQKAIVSERERIARELHDGVAQFIAYVSTKVMAARILLKKEQYQAADQQLDQVGQAVETQSVDIRASIIGLKMVTQSGAGLAESLGEYIVQCNRLSELQVLLDVQPPDRSMILDPETELHLLRIVQEAISNIRKHAKTQRAEVHLKFEEQQIWLIIRDGGIGFNPWQWSGSQPHFGLQTMSERAELIGAEFTVESEPGGGTTITVRLPIKDA